jgi:hypothetical protein
MRLTGQLRPPGRARSARKIPKTALASAPDAVDIGRPGRLSGLSFIAGSSRVRPAAFSNGNFYYREALHRHSEIFCAGDKEPYLATKTLIRGPGAVRPVGRRPGFCPCGPRGQDLARTDLCLSAARPNGWRPGCHEANRVARVCRKARMFCPGGTRGQAPDGADMPRNPPVCRE